MSFHIRVIRERDRSHILCSVATIHSIQTLDTPKLISSPVHKQNVTEKMNFVVRRLTESAFELPMKAVVVFGVSVNVTCVAFFAEFRKGLLLG